jgi:hypothetical protein
MRSVDPDRRATAQSQSTGKPEHRRRARWGSTSLGRIAPCSLSTALYIEARVSTTVDAHSLRFHRMT